MKAKQKSRAIKNTYVKKKKGKSRRVYRKINYEFQPDVALKKIFQEVRKETLIDLINGLCNLEIPYHSEVVFENTEHFSVLGNLEKKSVRGDLTLNVNNTQKVIIEFQSTEDDTMGFRLFVYGLNATTEDEKGTYAFPIGTTIYTVNNLPKVGEDLVKFKVDNFEVNGQSYSARNGDILTVKFPYVNLLKMNLADFKGSKLEFLQVVYLYKYLKNKELLGNTKEVVATVETIEHYIEQLPQKDKLVADHVHTDLLVDLKKLSLKENQAKEVIDVITENRMTYSERMSKMWKQEGIQEGIQQGIYEERQRFSEEREQSILRLYRRTGDEGLVFETFECDQAELNEILNALQSV